MYLTITSTAPPARDLGYLLHKHPDRAQRFDIAHGVAHVFYPEASDACCTAALLLEIDPISLVRRGRAGDDGFALGRYVNDRPYAASSMLAVALGKVFRTALAGRCDDRPELVDRPLPLEVRIPAVPSAGGAGLVTELFEPLGWTVAAEPVPLDETVPEWGASRYVDVRLHGDVVLAQALSHLYVLLPVLDDTKHYWVSADEVDKLVRAGGEWLAGHPSRDLITRRYLAHQREYVTTATARLTELDDLPPESLDAADGGEDDVSRDPAEPAPAPLAEVRRQAVLAELRRSGAKRVADLGCGEGGLVRELIADPAYEEVLGADVSPRALERAERRLGLDRMPDGQRARLRLIQSSLTYRDDRIAGYDAAVLMEVIEHVDPERLPALEAAVFEHARPGTVIVTTPNAEHNVRYEGLAAGGRRHPDHRFEWSRAEFARWAEDVAERTGYAVRLAGVGDDDAEVGAPTQMAVFTRTDRTSSEGADK